MNSRDAANQESIEIEGIYVSAGSLRAALSLPLREEEVRVFGRRSHSRFAINPASDGALRILNDVVVQPSEDNQLIAISREPGVVGEVLAVQILGPQGTVQMVVRIAESRTLVADGAVRHRLRLERIQQPEPAL